MFALKTSNSPSQTALDSGVDARGRKSKFLPLPAAFN